MKKPAAKIWYHGTKEKFEGEFKPLYLSSSKSLASLHGKVHAFTLDPNAKWLDISEVVYYTPGMDSIGYSTTWPEKLKNKGWDVVWDSEDYARGYPQIFVLNPKILNPIESELTETIDSLVKLVLNEELK